MNANKNHFSSEIDGLFWPLSVVSFRHRRTLTCICQAKVLQIDRAHFKLHLNQQHTTTASKDDDEKCHASMHFYYECVTVSESTSNKIRETMHARFFAQQNAFLVKKICIVANALILNSGAESNHFIAMIVRETGN